MTRRDHRYHQRVEALADYLASEGVLTDPLWREALHEVPRDRYVPDQAWAASFLPDAADRAIDRQADQSAWMDAIYKNFSIITQRDEGATDPTDTSGTPTCSLSCPHIAMTYLELLDLQPHHRVLEIGTGTGWTAAMLAWRLGETRITSIEVDPTLAATARKNVAGLTQGPAIVTGDGADGHPEQAPYDRLHVTCGVRDIPSAWLKQCRPGGTIVAPYMPIPGAYGHQLRLDVVDDETAIGRLLGGGGFMMLRSQRHTADLTPQEPEDRSTTRMDPRLIASADGGAQLHLAARVPELAIDASWDQHADGWAYVVRLTSLDGQSQARCAAVKGADEHEVWQSGPRRLWDEASEAYLDWLRSGRPGRDRYGILITSGKQCIWFEAPGFHP
jgi:protein-L-isoaspartate(D-aspartate) O-methyltransferase